MRMEIMPLGRRGAAALLALMAGLLVVTPRPATAAVDPKVQSSIRKGMEYLRQNIHNPRASSPWAGGRQSLAAMALLKGGASPNSPEVSAAVAAIFKKRDQTGKYNNGGASAHIYEAAVDASVLAEAGGPACQERLTAVAQYLIDHQLETGAWDYFNRGTYGDTSVTQYALLGLWTAAREGIPIPQATWERAGLWLLKHQMSEGSFNYVPGTTQGEGLGKPTLSMTGGGASSLLIVMMHLYPQEWVKFTTPNSAPAPRPKGSAILEKVDLSKPEVKSDLTLPQAPANPGVPLEDLRTATEKALGWMTTRFRPSADIGDKMYYYYTVERMAALANLERIGSQDWYKVCSDLLVSAQRPDGAWDLSQYETQGSDYCIGTSFALLFLMKSTGKILKRTESIPEIVGGLLTGGKGEPGSAPAERLEATPLDKLLQSLQNPGSVDLLNVQTELVDKVITGDRKALIGQKDQLIKLVRSDLPAVRRTAVWAIGRTNDLSLGKHLVDALEDPDLDVMIEANAALCWISRKFDGFGLPVNPLDDLPEDAGDEARQAAVEGWRAQARRQWGIWYLGVRPYNERGDEFEANLRQRLGDSK